MPSPSASDRPCRRVTRRILAARGAVLLAALTCSALPSTAGAADVKQECSAAYDRVQSLRADGKLIAARGEAVVCARDACTRFIKADCGKSLGEIDASTPTVVFEVRDAAGKETAEVRVLVDGKELLARLDGKAIPLDPGTHALRYEIAGATAVEDSVQVREGEKNRKLAASFERKSEPVTPPPGTVSPPSTGGPASEPSLASPATGGVPAWAWIAGGVGLVSVGVGVGFLVDSRSTQSAIDQGCTQKTAAQQAIAGCGDMKSTGDRDVALAAVLGGVGVIALGVSIFGIATARPSGTSARGPVTGIIPAIWLLPGASGASVKGVF